jgi:hypothetical protein
VGKSQVAGSSVGWGLHNIKGAFGGADSEREGNPTHTASGLLEGRAFRLVLPFPLSECQAYSEAGRVVLVLVLVLDCTFPDPEYDSRRFLERRPEVEVLGVFWLSTCTCVCGALSSDRSRLWARPLRPLDARIPVLCTALVPA